MGTVTWQWPVRRAIVPSFIVSLSLTPVAISDGVKARAPKAKDKVINRDKGLRQGHDEPTQYNFLWRKYLPVTNSVY